MSEAQGNYALTIAAFASPKGTLDCIAAFSSTDFRPDLERMRLPTLILHGDSDAIVPFEASGQRAHAMIQGSRLELIRGGPHGIHTTHADSFNRALLEFLAG